MEKTRWAKHVERIWERRVAYRILVGKPERKIPSGRSMLTWENNIKMDLQDVRWGGWGGGGHGLD
jgi:hypothetical protein